MREKCFGGEGRRLPRRCVPVRSFALPWATLLPNPVIQCVRFATLRVTDFPRRFTPKHFATTKRALPRFAIPSWLLVLQWLRDYFLHASALFVVSRLSGCHPWRFIQLQAVATYQTDATRTSCCGLHLYYASSPRPAVSLSYGESCVIGSRLPAGQLRFVH